MNRKTLLFTAPLAALLIGPTVTPAFADDDGDEYYEREYEGNDRDDRLEHGSKTLNLSLGDAETLVRSELIRRGWSNLEIGTAESRTETAYRFPLVDRQTGSVFRTVEVNRFTGQIRPVR